MLARHQVDVDLARTHEHATDVVGPCHRVGIADHHAEAAFGQLARRRQHHLVTEQALRGEHDQRQRVDREQRRLPPQQVEELRSGRAVGEPQVDIGGHLKKALRAGAGMIGTLSFVRVRQQQHERWPQPPLATARHEELVEHRLRAVDEVAVLRFPDHEPGRFLDVVAELVADQRVLGERTVDDFERGARLRHVLQRHEPSTGPGIVEHGVPVAEGAAFHVLARQPNAGAIGEDRRVRQLLSRRPIHRARLIVVEHRRPLLAHALEFAMDGESVR